MAVAKKNSEFGVCAFPLVTVLGRFPLGQRTGKVGLACCALQQGGKRDLRNAGPAKQASPGRASYCTRDRENFLLRELGVY